MGVEQLDDIEDWDDRLLALGIYNHAISPNGTKKIIDVVRSKGWTPPSEVQELTSELLDKTAQVSKMYDRLQEIRGEIADLESAAKDYQNTAEKTVQDYKNAITALQGESDILANKLSTQTSKVRTLEKELDKSGWVIRFANQHLTHELQRMVDRTGVPKILLSKEVFRTRPVSYTKAKDHTVHPFPESGRVDEIEPLKRNNVQIRPT